MGAFAAFLSVWTRVRRYAAWGGGGMLCLALTACGGTGTPNPASLSVDDLFGVYVLASYEGQFLPSGNGRTTYYGGSLNLERDGRYTETIDAEVCSPAAPCTRDTSFSGGTWLLLRDGTLYLDPQEGYSWPPPRVEADGQEVRVYIPDADLLTFTYRRQ